MCLFKTLSETTLPILGLAMLSHTASPTTSSSPMATRAFWIRIISRILPWSVSSRSQGKLAVQRLSARTRTTDNLALDLGCT